MAIAILGGLYCFGDQYSIVFSTLAQRRAFQKANIDGVYVAFCTVKVKKHRASNGLSAFLALVGVVQAMP